MNWRVFLFIPAVALGVGLFVWQNRPIADEDSATAIEVSPPAVRVDRIKAKSFPIVVSGFGRVEPVQKWDAISQVDGRVIFVANALGVGEIYPAGTEIIRIDPRDYEIRLARAEADLSSAIAQLDELDAEAENTQDQLALEQEIEGVLQADLDRRISLTTAGASSQTVVEQARRDLLTQQRKVLDLRNQITLFPVQRVTAQANIRTREVEREEAERDLAQTVIRTPFRGRVASNAITLDEYVRSGEVLLELHDISAAEVTASVQPNDLSNAVRAILPDGLDFNLVLQDADAASEILTNLDLSISVHQTIGDLTHKWPATIQRFRGATDTTTGSLGIVVLIDAPFAPDRATLRPPLNDGSFVEVRFSRSTRDNTIAIPRSLLRYAEDGQRYVYVLGEGNDLERRAINGSSTLDNYLIIQNGLDVGDIVLLSTPQPAILGQVLSPVYTGE